MKTLSSRLTLRLSILSGLLLAAAIILLGSGLQIPRGSANAARIVMQSKVKNNPYIILQEGRDLSPVYTAATTGGFTAQSAGTKNAILPDQARPLALASSDLNGDGFADLICGYAGSGGGMLALHMANQQAFTPRDPAVLKGIAKGRFPDPFLKDASVIRLPEAPDFIAAGDFTRDGHTDLAVAARSSNTLYLLVGDGHGGFSSIEHMALSGGVTAMAAGHINQRNGLTDLLVGVSTGGSASLLAFDGTASLLATMPATYSLAAEVKSLAAGDLDDDSLGDVAMVAGSQVMILHGRGPDGFSADEKTGQLEAVSLPFGARALALGDFIWNRDGRTEMAVMGDDGAVHILARGDLDARPLTAEEVKAGRQKQASLRAQADKARKGGQPVAMAAARQTVEHLQWKVAEDMAAPAADSVTAQSATASDSSSQPILLSTRISALPSDDLLVMNPGRHQLQVMYRPSAKASGGQMAAQSLERSAVSVDTVDDVAAVLPMRVSVDGRPGLVLMSKGHRGPSIMVPMAAQVFTVTKNADTNDGVCDGDCSLREAIVAANANPGADTIVFNPGINPTLSIDSGGAPESNAATGDLDINDSVTIVGNSQTVISTTYTSACGDCKVFGVNQDGIYPDLTVSFNGVTIQNGFNNGTNFQGSFFETGGGIDFFLVGTNNSHSMTNCVITNNTAIGSFLSHGAGVNVDSFNTGSAGGPSAGSVTFTSCTISNNTAQEFGGGLSLSADNHDATLTNCVVTGNTATNEDGGGIWIRHSFGGTVTINGASGAVSNNSAVVGGGISVVGNEVANISDITISNNTATGPASAGGGILIATLGAAGVTGSTSLTGVTISGNHADNGPGASGGGIYFTDFYGASLTNCTISGNTSESGAGIFNGGSSANPPATLAISGGAISGNTASGSGGGVATASASTMISKATITGNSAATSGGGLFVSGGTLTANFCRIAGNTAPVGSGLAQTGGTASVENNWWGTNTPASVISGTADFSPWLLLTHTANPSSILTGCSTTLTASFLINSDGAPVSPSDLTVLGGVPVTFSNPVLGTISNAESTIQPSGMATATFTAGSTGGNGSADATVDSATVTASIQISQPPAITCPSNISQNADAGQCSAVVNYTTPTATGFPTPTVTCTPASGSTFPAGTTTVTCTASNGIHPDATCASPGSAADPTCSFTVTVVDNQPPVLSACPSPITSNTDAGQCSAVVTYTTPTATDNCSGATVTCSPASGSTFNKGTTTVTCTATDASNNTATCSFTVTVNDNQPPTLGACPSPITANTSPNQCSAVVNYTTPTVTDNCPGATVACSPASGATFPKGTTTVTCTATDASSLTATCSFTVTVADHQPPAITCPGNISTIENPPGSGCRVVTYATPTPTDNCPGATASCTPPSGTCFAIGTTTVTCTATDTSANTASCSFTVQVATACTISCPSNVSVNNTPNQCGAIVNYPAPTVSAGCGAVTCTPASGTFFPVGTTSVTCTTAVGPSCGFTVTVHDAQGPTITFTGPISLWPPNHKYSTFTIAQLVASADDNCDSSVDINDVVITKVTSDEPDNGSGDGNTTNDIVIAADCKSVQLRAERSGSGNGRVYTITFKVVDSAGNVTTASRTVTVPHNVGGTAIDDGPANTVTSNCAP